MFNTLMKVSEYAGMKSGVRKIKLNPFARNKVTRTKNGFTNPASQSDFDISSTWSSVSLASTRNVVSAPYLPHDYLLIYHVSVSQFSSRWRYVRRIMWCVCVMSVFILFRIKVLRLGYLFWCHQILLLFSFSVRISSIFLTLHSDPRVQAV
jgi:hypothetical protein